MTLDEYKAQHEKIRIQATEVHIDTKCGRGLCRNRARWMCECGSFLCGRCLSSHQAKNETAWKLCRKEGKI